MLRRPKHSKIEVVAPKEEEETPPTPNFMKTDKTLLPSYRRKDRRCLNVRLILFRKNT